MGSREQSRSAHSTAEVLGPVYIRFHGPSFWYRETGSVTLKLQGLGLAALGKANTEVLSSPPMRTKPSGAAVPESSSQNLTEPPRDPVKRVRSSPNAVFGMNEADFEKMEIRADFMACYAGHPFWDGLEYDLEIHHRRSEEASTGGVFLARRLREGLRFLKKDSEWPELLVQSVFAEGPDQGRSSLKSEPWLQLLGNSEPC